MKTLAFGQTDVGRKRAHNEDTFIIDDDVGAYIVCDGMGGAAAGEVAAEMASTLTLDYLRENIDTISRFGKSPEDNDDVVNLLRQAIEKASYAVHTRAMTEEGKAGMGCTLTMVLVVQGGKRAILGHVGDSRLYMRRNDELHQLSDDHSYVAEMVRRGMLSKEQAKSSPYGNVITRAIGIQNSVQVDTLVFDLLPRDTLLLCSDGLCGYYEENPQGIYDVMSKSDSLTAMAADLIAAANDAGGKDNVTTLLISVEGDAKDTSQERTTEVNLRLDTLRYIDLFKHLNMKEMVVVLEVFKKLDVEKGTVLIREGETTDGLFVLLDGECSVYRAGKELATIRAGSHFGEMALLNQRPRSATVTATKRTQILRMDRGPFDLTLKRNPELGVKFLWTFAQVLALRLDENHRQNELNSLRAPDTVKMTTRDID
ncbi:MAG: cyclic nucleotide-binding domain-containing protein [Deltaproteobacteria bacterium]|nr:cyclic nucleotide-binding domain-containing protein [Deltaproteobacteria bacterium]